MKWSKVSAGFNSEGELRDIYVLDTTLADWQAVIDALKKEMHGLVFQIGGETGQLPDNISVLFNLGPEEVTSSLYIPFGQSTLNCHFFRESQIEFDLDPRDMGPELLEPLLDFLMLLGKATGKLVSLTLENTPEAEIMRFDPATTEVIYVGPSSLT